MKRLLVTLALCLGGCAPRHSAERFEVTYPLSAVTFYPATAGLRWEYLEPGEDVTAPRFRKEVLGKTRIGEQILTMSRFYGRGFNVTSFEDYRADGVFLVREDRAGSVLVYEPAYQAWPAQKDLTLGASWGGNTTAKIYKDRGGVDSAAIRYRYTVVDTRRLKLGKGEAERVFEVFVVSLQTTEDVAGRAVQSNAEVFFMPYVGEVRTRSGLFLIDTNFAVPSTGAEPDR